MLLCNPKEPEKKHITQKYRYFRSSFNKWKEEKDWREKKKVDLHGWKNNRPDISTFLL